MIKLRRSPDGMTEKEAWMLVCALIERLARNGFILKVDNLLGLDK